MFPPPAWILYGLILLKFLALRGIEVIVEALSKISKTTETIAEKFILGSTFITLLDQLISSVLHKALNSRFIRK